jgi:hypothetical protein
MTPVPTPDPFICENVHTGPYCGFPEITLLGCLYCVLAVISIFLLYLTVRGILSGRQGGHGSLFNQITLFWIFLTIWQLHGAAVLLVHFDWTPITFRLCGPTLKHLLIFFSMCMMILVLFDLLFKFHNPGTNATVFFRSLFLLFLGTFIIIGVILSIFGPANESEAERSMALWCAATDFVIVIFFAMPAWSLLQAATYPMVQPEDYCCVQFCKVGIAVFVILFSGRVLWNATNFFHINYIENWEGQAKGELDVGRRIINFFFSFVFDFSTAVLTMIAMFLFQKHDLMFNENPYYSRQSEI